MLRVSSHQSVQATSSTLLAAGFQHHSLSKNLPAPKVVDIALAFIPQSIHTSQTELFTQH